MNRDLYEKILNELLELNEFSTMGGGAVGGVATPLGTGPKAGKGGGNIYKKSTATDKKHRSKGKKKKTYTRSVQWYLKNGGEKGRKRSLKEVFSNLNNNLLLERTDRLYDLSPQEVLIFLGHLKGDILQDVTFEISEKISGQNTTIGIEGSATGNKYYFAVKSQLENNNNIFSRRFLNGAAASRRVKRHFISQYGGVRQLQPNEKIKLGVEIIKGDKTKPDYIAYGVPSRQTQVAVFTGDFTAEDAKKLSNRKIIFLSSEDIKKTPVGREKLSQEVANILDELYNKVEQSLNLNAKQFKKFIKDEILPDFRSNITALFGTSHINTLSPIEGIAVNMTRGESSRFFKVHSEEFENIQQIQTSLYSEFKSNRSLTPKQKRGIEDLPFSNKAFLNFKDRFGNFIRAALLYDYVNDIGRQRNYRSLGFHVFNFIKQVSEMDHFENTRVFFSPESFKSLCTKLFNAINTNQPEDYIDVINFLGTNIPTQTVFVKKYAGRDRRGNPKFRNSSRSEYVWHTISGSEDYNCPEADQIKNLNLV